MSVDPLLVGIAAVVALGVGAQILATRFRIPSVLFLVVAGVVVGPAGLGLVPRDAVADAVPSLIGAGVAIVIFQDGFALDVDSMRSVRRETLALVTVGAAVTMLGTAIAVRYALDASWGVSLLVGALLVATGPTVLVPILNAVDAPERVSTILRTEGLLNDITSAVVAVAVFEAVTLQETNVEAFLVEVLTRLGIGVAVGGVVAIATWFVLNRVDLSAGYAVQNTRLLVFATAIVAYVVAEVGSGEAGIAAAATAGLVLGNVHVPYRESVDEFEDDLSLLVLSILFVVLTTLVEVEGLLGLGVGGLVVVAAVVLVVRPLAVLASTWTGQFSLRERVFMSAIAPRGVLTAGLATLFAVDLRESNPEAAATILGTVFLVILATSALEGGVARHVARALDVESVPVVVVGAGRYGRLLARQYEAGGTRVELVDPDEERIERGREEGFVVHAGDGTDTDFLRSIGAADAGLVVAATDDDAVNRAVARIVADGFGASAAARANDPTARRHLEDAGAQVLPASLPDGASADVERDEGWIMVPSAVGAIREVPVRDAEWTGLTVGDVEASLPPSCFATTVRRDDDSVVATTDVTLADGDVLVVVGRPQALAELVDVGPDPVAGTGSTGSERDDHST
ncbi:potassium transporter [Halorubellus sp. JP-L1]|uniref:cation:proton antiporter domain-containing protein n=1 Tax=Halorubellus sp. JP-L1 TaxID=2715753 RepID=UPI00140799B0|nr:potassium transporter [Halorubellus sp. JP-L1]